ncbi:MAG: amino acid permease [Chloroflexi bacterium]|nr:amino acid permease [Chloroflexota bacterium]
MADIVIPSAGAEADRKLYARKSSGLVRTIGVFGAMVFGVHCISLSSSGLIPFSWVAGVWPGSSIIGVLTVAMFFCLFHAYTYATIGATMPRSAADYTLGSRVLSAPLAFAASWTLVIFSAMVAGSLIAWIPKTGLPVMTRTMGIIMNNPSMLAFADWSVTSTGIILIGSICTVITFFTMILPTRTIVRILEVGFILGLIAWAILYFQLGTAAKDAFPVAWDKFMGAGSYEGRIALAKANGMITNPNVAIMTLAGLIMGFWIFYGYYIPTFFAGEVKQAESTLLAGSWSSLLVTWAIFVLAAILLQRLVPLEWIAAESYLSNTGYSGGPTMPWITFYAAILKPSFILILIVAIAWVYTLINLAQTYFFYCSRIIFAWSFDRLVPEAVCWIHPKLHSPIWAILIITIIAEVGVIDAALGSVMGAQLNFVFFAVWTQLVPVLAMTLFPFLKPDLFENASAMVRRKIGKVPVITIVGGITLTYLVWMIIASFLYPAVGGRIGVSNLLVLAGFFVSGFIVFYVARSVRMSREGIDLNWTFKSVPPV